VFANAPGWWGHSLCITDAAQLETVNVSCRPIRMAIGADRRAITRLFVGQGALVLTVGSTSASRARSSSGAYGARSCLVWSPPTRL
jgi:hypothetical protein